MVKVLGLGSPLVDILVNVEDAFLDNVIGEKGGMVYVDIPQIESLLKKVPDEPKMVPGGSAANTILALTKLGVPTGFLGQVGNDYMAKFYIGNYEHAGGDVSQFKVSNTDPTGQCLSLITPDSERTMRTCLGAAATISPDSISKDDFIGYTHLHIEGYMVHNHEVIEKALRLAKEAGLEVCLDLASFEIVRDDREFLGELLKSYVDVVFCNEDEAVQYTGTDNPEDIFDKLDGVCDVIALKLGKQGAIIKAGNIKVKANARIVDAVDTTGAGDLWQAGFLYAYVGHKKLTGKLLEKAGGFGAVLGAEIVQIIGASIPETRWAEIRKKFEIGPNTNRDSE
jgi:sugar/nucleoside kinase (ribokinase family)